jgi:hypothetical protein
MEEEGLTIIEQRNCLMDQDLEEEHIAHQEDMMNYLNFLIAILTLSLSLKQS